MKRTWTLAGAVALVAAALSIALLSRSGSAAPSTTSPSSTPTSSSTTAPPSATVQHDVLSMAAAQQLATAAQQDCASRGFAVTVAVVDPDGIDIVLLRADGATGATVAVARGKAHAAAGFQSPTGALNDQAKTTPGLVALPDFVILPGGEPIAIGGALVGGVGVSGAPSGDIDDQCALTGIHAVVPPG